MGRLQIFDNFNRSSCGKVKMPKFKGHVKVTLHNCRTGKNEVSEGDNIVTNAFSDILASNYLQGVDASKIFGTDGVWKKWFGGVLLFEQFHQSSGGVINPANYYPYADSENHLIAHAGQNPIDAEHDDDIKRGNPVPLVYIETENSMKMVWEWGSVRGNGNIRSLSLCHSDLGDVGLGSDTYGFQHFDPFENLASSAFPKVATSLLAPDNLFTQYDDYNGLYFEIGDGTGEGSEGFYPEHTRFQTKKLTVYVKRLPYSGAGLFETMKVRTNFIRKFTIELEDFNLYLQPCYHFDYTNKRLWIFSNATSINSSHSTICNYAVIDCINETVLSEGTLESDTANLAPIPMQINATLSANRDQFMNYNIITDGTWVWLPTTSGANWSEFRGYTNTNGFKKIKISDSTCDDDVEYNDVQQRQNGIMKAGGLMVMSGRVVNGNTGFTCVDNYPVNNDTNLGYTVTSFHEPYKPVTLATRVGASSGSANNPRFILANKCLLTTKFNLNSMVEKNASKSMTVEYTLTELSGS